MNEPSRLVPLPQTGWHKLEEWAAAIGEEPRTLRRKLDAASIPRAAWGNQCFVHADRISDFLHSIETPIKKAPLPKPRSRRRASV